MTTGTHSARADARNERILININGELFPREKAVVSVFDSGFILGDGVWEGLRLHRGYADTQDPRINSHSKLNCIFACIQAAKAGCDEALMLDPHGHVATCNSTHFFIVREGEVWTSSGDYCLDGITRRNIINICKTAGIPVFERNFSVMQAYGAEEAFVTGTFAGVTPVAEIDGRAIGDNNPGPPPGGRASCIKN